MTYRVHCPAVLRSEHTVLQAQIGQPSSLFSAKTIILLKMYFTSGLLSLFLLSLFSPIFASPIDPSDSLPTRTTGNSNDPSLTLGAHGAAGSYYCISPAEYPDWAGPIDYDDCKAGYNAISNVIKDKETRYTFWSEKYRSRAPPQSFELPWGTTRGKPFTRRLSAFHPFHSLTMTLSRQLYIGPSHRSGLRIECATTRRRLLQRDPLANGR